MSTDRFNLLGRSSRLECVGSLELSTLLPPIFFQPLRQPEVGDARIWRRPQALPDRQEACGSKARRTLRLWLRVWSSFSPSPVSFNTWGQLRQKVLVELAGQLVEVKLHDGPMCHHAVQKAQVGPIPRARLCGFIPRQKLCGWMPKSRGWGLNPTHSGDIARIAPSFSAGHTCVSHRLCGRVPPS
jgi:hypothetical protein